jgi:DNA-binding CsgD family transcriptional regulator
VGPRLLHSGLASISRKRLADLAGRDPGFPRPLPSAGRERVWWWRWQLLPYLEPGTEPDLVHATAAAERVVRDGYAASMSRQRIRQLSYLDPLFPAPLPSVGQERLWSWTLQLQPYFQLLYDPRPVAGRFRLGPPRRRSRAVRQAHDRGSLPMIWALTGRDVQLLRATVAARTAVQALTARQTQVLGALAAGETDLAVIGRALGIGPFTVKRHLVAAYRRLGVTSQADAAARWLQASNTRPCPRRPRFRAESRPEVQVGPASWENAPRPARVTSSAASGRLAATKAATSWSTSSRSATRRWPSTHTSVTSAAWPQ